jgi:Pentapeptide repeats (8 copies)
MPYNLLMPEEEQKSLRPRWVPPWLWQLRWWILGTLFILVWWLVPPLLYRHTGTAKETKLKAITDTRTALLAGLIGVGALLTFWLNSRVYRITARTLEMTEQGHITDRYTKAIEQLGQAELAMRLGGVYALERIAKDSERDHPTVVEVLSAFVREESRKHSTPRGRQGITQEAATETDTAAPGGDTKSGLATDVQAAMTVLGRLPQRPDIRRADLIEAHLSGARLDGADLSGALLIKADLSGADLVEANLVGAQLVKVNLSGARPVGADLSGADLSAADLSGAWLAGANLSGALGLSQTQLDAARGDAETRLPEGLQRPDSWATGEESAPVSS